MSAGPVPVLTVRRRAGAGRRRTGAGQFNSFPWWIYLLVIPPVAYRLFWNAWPLAQTAYLSLTDTNFIYGTSAFTGLANYRDLFADSGFYRSMVTTVSYAAIIVVGTVVLGLLIARMLVRAMPGRALGRVAILVPFIIPSVLAAQMWRTMVADSGSPVNSLLIALQLTDQEIPWLSSDWGARAIVVAASLWRSVPFVAILLLAALTGVPKEVKEAAAVDGATPWRQFFSVELPMIRTTVLVVATFQAIEALRMFDVVYGLTKGGPGSATELISFRAYQDMFFYGKSGYGSAQAMVLVLATAVVVGLMGRALVKAQRSQA